MTNLLTKIILGAFIFISLPYAALGNEEQEEERQYATAENLCYEVANMRATDEASWRQVVARCLYDRGFRSDPKNNR